jgi:hypothetical protein
MFTIDIPRVVTEKKAEALPPLASFSGNAA